MRKAITRAVVAGSTGSPPGYGALAGLLRITVEPASV
jgi:hypothetical protein